MAVFNSVLPWSKIKHRTCSHPRNDIRNINWNQTSSLRWTRHSQRLGGGHTPTDTMLSVKGSEMALPITIWSYHFWKPTMAGKMIHFQQPFGAVKRELLEGFCCYILGGGFRISLTDFSYLRFGKPHFFADTPFLKTVMPTKMMLHLPNETSFQQTRDFASFCLIFTGVSFKKTNQTWKNIGKQYIFFFKGHTKWLFCRGK